MKSPFAVLLLAAFIACSSLAPGRLSPDAGKTVFSCGFGINYFVGEAIPTVSLTLSLSYGFTDNLYAGVTSSLPFWANDVFILFLEPYLGYSLLKNDADILNLIISAKIFISNYNPAFTLVGGLANIFINDQLKYYAAASVILFDPDELLLMQVALGIGLRGSQNIDYYNFELQSTFSIFDVQDNFSVSGLLGIDFLW